MPKVNPLPPTAQDVADVIGRALTLKLAREVHYRSLYVPFKLSPTHWIARCIGYPAALKLQREFVGMGLPLANCRGIAVGERNKRIVDAVNGGTPTHVVAELLGLSLRTVQGVVAASRKRAECAERRPRGLLT